MSTTRLAIRDLQRAPGARRHLEGEVELGEVGLSSARLVDGASVSYDVVLEALDAQVTAVGTVRGEWVGSCRRCLEETSGTVEAPLSEVFEPNPVEGETWPIQDGKIDLLPALTTAILLELPLAPVCSPACAGPAPDRYPTETEADQNPDEAPRDPRWAALDVLRTDDD